MSTLKFYLAARYSRREELCGYREHIHGLGAEVTSRWLDGNHQISDAGTPIGEQGEHLVEGGERAIRPHEIEVGMRVRVQEGTTEGVVTKVRHRPEIKTTYAVLDWQYGPSTHVWRWKYPAIVLPTPDHEERAAALRQHFAVEDAADVEAADGLIAFTEAPRSAASRGGRHVEFGLALGLGKQVIVVGPRENVFCWLPGVVQFDTWDEAREHLGFLVQMANVYAGQA